MVYQLILDTDAQVGRVQATVYKDQPDGLDVERLAQTTFGPFDTATDFWRWFHRIVDSHPIFPLK